LYPSVTEHLGGGKIVTPIIGISPFMKNIRKKQAPFFSGAQTKEEKNR
jgi:hypothetical protein